MLHRVIGIIVAIFFVQVFTGNSEFFIGYQKSMSINLDGMGGNGKALQGHVFIYLSAISSVVCLALPDQLEARYNKWSWTGVGKQWPAGFFILLGYLCVCLTIILFYVFE